MAGRLLDTPAILVMKIVLGLRKISNTRIFAVQISNNSSMHGPCLYVTILGIHDYISVGRFTFLDKEDRNNEKACVLDISFPCSCWC